MRKIPVPWSNPSEAVVYIVLLLIIIGTVNVFSASFVMADQQLHDSYFFLKKHLIAIVIGFIGLVAAAKYDYRKLPRIIMPATIGVTIMLVAIYFIGVEANGARRWLKIGIIFQPSEFAKLTAVIMAAAYLGPRIDRGKPVTLYSLPVIMAGLMAALVLKQPDMGTAVVILGSCIVLYLPAGLPKRQMGLLFGGAIAALCYLAVNAAYRAERISAWLDPWSYQQTSGYQSVQALLAIGSGSLLGSGLGRGASKFLYLPEAHTDFAYAVLCQEWGFFGAIIVLILFALLARNGIKIALKATDGFGSMLALGLTLMLVGQAIGNIAMVSGLLPVTGVPLPFISFGGTSLMLNLLTIGLLISVGRRANVTATEPEPIEVNKPVRRLKSVPRTK